MDFHLQFSPDSTPGMRLKATMFARGHKRISSLARAMGLPRNTVFNASQDHPVGKPTQERIENFLGAPIWSTSEEFAERKESAKQHEPATP